MIVEKLSTSDEKGVSLFTGQTMVCVVCRKRQKSDPRIVSNWRAIQITSRVVYYVCPDEFPPDGASPGEFEAAYSKVLVEIARLRQEDKTCDRLRPGNAACLNTAQWRVKIIFRPPRELAHCHFKPVEMVMSIKVCSQCRADVKAKELLADEGWEKVREALNGLKLNFSLSRKGARVAFAPLFSIRNN